MEELLRTEACATTMSQYERGLTFAIKQIEDIRFPFCKVTSPFCPSSAFSQLDFEIEAYVRDDRPSRVGLSLKELFKVEAVDPAFDSALKFIVNGKNHIWPPFTTSTTERSEKDVMVTLCKILTPLSSEVILEGTYKTHLALERESVLLSVGDIGIGSVHTWHGSPDARVRGVPVVCLKAAEDSNFQFEVLDDGSDDESVTASECKVVVRPKNLKQAIATCVVSSFIAKARHPDKPAVVPTILINENQFCVCLYDCEKDVLMISDHRLLATNGHLSRSGLAFLWLVINHR